MTATPSVADDLHGRSNPLEGPSGDDAPGERPKLRADLVVRHVEDDVVLKNPATQVFIRLGPVEWAIARRFDGETTLEAARAAAEAETECELEADEVRAFVEHLRGLGYLAGAGEEAVRSEPPRVQGDLFYLRFRAIDPDEALARWAARLSFLFSRGALFVSALLFGMGASVAMTHRDAIVASVPSLFEARGLAIVWLVLLFVMVLHELAHGLACKRFGGQVHEMGFMLIYLQPAMYCNVSDAWLFPERWKRVAVAFAGAYCELVIWAAAALVWRVTETDTLVNRIALAIVATSFVKTLVNLNPLIKLDGYYALSDLLGVPNLRSRSFAYVRTRFRALFGRTPESNESARTESARTRRIHLVYGLVAGLYTLSVLGALAVYLVGAFGERHRLLGVALACVFVLPSLRGSFGGAARATPDADAPTVGPERALRSLARLLSPRARGLLAACVLVSLAFARPLVTVGGECEVRPARAPTVHAAIDGIVSTAYADVGDEVPAGAPLVRIVNVEYEHQLATTTAEIGVRRARLELLESGPRREAIASYRAVVDVREAELRHAETEFARVARLFASGALPEAHVALARTQREVVGRELVGARAELANLRLGSREEEIRAAAHELARDEERRAFLVERLSRAVVRSPHAGVVSTRLRDTLGRRIRAGDVVAEVQATEALVAEVRVDESDVLDVRRGRPATLRFRALPERTFRGVVSEIAPVASRLVRKQDARFVVVRVALRDLDAARVLRAGTTGHARVEVGRRPVYAIVRRWLARLVRLDVWSTLSF